MNIQQNKRVDFSLVFEVHSYGSMDWDNSKKYPYFIKGLLESFLAMIVILSIYYKLQI